MNHNDIKIFQKACSSVDRASDSDSESRGFDSLHAYPFYKIKIFNKFTYSNLNRLKLSQ